MKKIFLFLFLILSPVSGAGLIHAANKEIKMHSPNGRLELTIQLSDTLSYSLECGGENLVKNAHIGLELADGRILGKKAQLQQQKTRTATENIVSPNYRFDKFT